MAEDLVTIQTDISTREKLRRLSKEDIRSMTGELTWLVDQELAHRYSHPNPCISVEEVQAAAASVSTETVDARKNGNEG